MAITFFSAKQFGKPLKATIQKTGRLGFTSTTTETLALDTDTFLRFGQDDSNKENLLMIVDKQESEDAFRVIKSGDYYYAPTAALFDMLEYDYKKETIIFDLRRNKSLDEEAGGIVYVMEKRAPKTSNRRASKTKTNTSDEETLSDD